MQFVLKSTNEHPYHCTVYSYSKVDWDKMRDHLRDVPWLDIFKPDVTYAAKEITEWVKIGIDCYIPHRKFQLKPHSSSWFTPCTAAIAYHNHYFHQYHRNAIPENMKLFCDCRNHCSFSDLVTSRGFSTEFSTGGKSIIPPLFNGPKLLSTSTDKANLC